MPDRFITANLKAVLAERATPAVTLWNRLEGRPRAETFERALRAEVRDPLWMLTRQWQVGEFRGDDAGSPIVAKVRVQTARLQKYAAGDATAEPFDRVDAVRDARGADAHSPGTRCAADVARHPSAHGPLLAQARRAPRIGGGRRVHRGVPRGFTGSTAARRRPDRCPSGILGGCRGCRRSRDGWREVVRAPEEGGRSCLGRDRARSPGGKRRRMRSGPVSSPGSNGPSRSRPGRKHGCPIASNTSSAVRPPMGEHEKVLVADEYSRGQIDWYQLDVDRSRERLGDAAMPSQGESARTLSMVPAPATFGGMPHSRWWTFEEGRTNFGEIRPDTTDLAKLLLIEFGLVYANDWHIVPCAVPAGTVATIRGMAVTTVFGDRIWIDHAGAGDDDQWQRWAMFLMSVKGQGHDAADLSLLTPPAAHNILDGPPIEEVVLARDEMANMVWGIERVVPLTSGESKPGPRSGR